MPAMKSQKYELTPEQQAMRDADPNQHYRVIATPGSGKTTVLTNYCRKLIDEEEVDPTGILMVTFSKSAAVEMKRRLGDLTPEAEKVKVCTLHSLCFSICRDAANGSPYANREVDNWPAWKTEKTIRDLLKHDYDIEDEVKGAALVRHIVDSYSASKHYRKGAWIQDNDKGQIRVKVPRTKDRRKREEEKQSNQSPFIETSITASYYEFFDDIEKKKKIEKGIEFDDMIQYALDLLETNQEMRTEWQNKFTHILIDEFQDTDWCQYEICKLLTGAGARLTVVSDPDQCVYEWRNADPTIVVTKIKKDYPDMVDMPLTTNFRSGYKIVDLANNVIQYNVNRIKKRIVAHDDAVEGYVFWQPKPPHREIPKLIEAGCPLHEMAVLNRLNADSLVAEGFCLDNNIPYVVHGNYSMHENRPVKAVMDYLRLVFDEDESEKINNCFLDIIRVPNRKISNASMRELISKAKRKKMSVLTYLENSDYQITKNPMYNRHLDKLKNDLATVRSQKGKLSLAALVRMLNTTFKIVDHFSTEANDPNEDPALSIENFAQLLGDHPTLDRLNEIEWRIKNLKGDAEHKKHRKNRLQILTGHKAKGLEYDVVFVHADKYHFPINPQKPTEEERRLFYVMITRARKMVFLSGDSEFCGEAVKGMELDRLDSDIDYSAHWVAKKKEVQSLFDGFSF